MRQYSKFTDNKDPVVAVLLDRLFQVLDEITGGEYEVEGKKPISLIDGKALVDRTLNHFSEIDTKYQKIIGVKEKQVAIGDKFEFV
ncbi:hypothetical protein JW710_00880 [Candidatus Dojkabacteria bacterium]|nr:hypothetical protein [Candidatus Dojkabacteria bacterium]